MGVPSLGVPPRYLPEVPNDGRVGPGVLGVGPQLPVLVDHQREGLVEPAVGGSGGQGRLGAMGGAAGG